MAASKAKEKKAPPTPEEKKAKAAAQGVKTRLKEEEEKLTFKPNETERVARTYFKRRIQEMQDHRTTMDIEKRWREADAEYIPHELDFGTTRKRFETDQDTGLRSRMVPVGDATQQWRETSSAPTLLAKIQTAVAIIIDNQPEADLVALIKKYEKTTDLAYALWKRNWTITDAKEKLKLTVFNLIKYGWAPQRTYPRKVEYDKRVLVETDPTNPENDRYEDRKITWFNDIDRQPLDPYRTWIDEMAKPYDPYSTNEAYYELDYSYDAFCVEFGKYPNYKYVPRDSVMIRGDEKKKNNRNDKDQEQLTRKDIVTVGFFESRHKDLYGIYIPRHNIVLYLSPMPNDDGYLSITHTLWLLRSANLPYGISLWEIIRQNKTLYDKMKNMTMDQLVLSIMKFGVFSGSSPTIGDGVMAVVPGQARQINSPSGDASKAVSWMQIPGPGEEAWDGLQKVAEMMDDDSGISPILEGEVTGKTLGEILHAKEASMKRIKVPVENIAWLIEQDAYLTLSWMSQVYSIPEVKEFATLEEMTAYEKEQGIERTTLFGQHETDEGGQPTGNYTGPYQAHYLPQLALHLEDQDGQLTKSKTSRFYQVGKDIQPSELKWKGIFKVIPRSIIDSSQELVKAAKMEMANLLLPLFGQPAELVAKAAKQIVEVHEQDPKDWLPDSFLDYLENGPAPQAPAQPLPAFPGGPTMPGAPAVPPAAPGAPAPGGAPQSMQADAGMTPAQPQTVVPQEQVAPAIPPMRPGPAGSFNRGL